MNIRQSVISVFQPIAGTGKHEITPSLEIIFRQPFHNLGLAYSFSFSKSYFSPFSTCELNIENINTQIVDAFSFDTKTYTNRPLVEIRAGYSDVKIKTISELNLLKQNLPLIYSGAPYYSQDNKIIGGRTLNIQLSDLLGFVRVGRFSKSYRKGRLITDIITDLLLSIEGIKADVSALRSDPNTSILKLENPLLYNNRHIITDILPELSKQYRFYFFVGPGGTYIFKPASNTTPGIFNIINSKNGMVEHPVGINFVQWRIRTLFGLPGLMYPGDRVRIESEHFRRITLPDPAIPPPPGKNLDNILEGLIVDANYNWDDSSAEIQYTIAADGQPVNANPVIQI